MFLFPFTSLSHPGIGIVKDRKGNIFYTDLKQVWKISNGKRSIVVPDVHTHELYVDSHDNLYGEGGDYNARTNKFYHYQWVYRSNGRLDTVVKMKEAYVHQDFSFARDRKGNEYYSKQFLTRPDTSHIFRRSASGQETIFATGSFKGVSWLHPQDDGSLLYVLKNAIYMVDSTGTIRLVLRNVGNTKPSFKFSGNSITIWGAWQDEAKNIYAAVFSDQAVKKIDTSGNMTVIYRSRGNWAPLHGVFDDKHRLWILEGSDKNEVRVTLAAISPATTTESETSVSMPYFIFGFLGLSAMLLYLGFREKEGRCKAGR